MMAAGFEKLIHPQQMMWGWFVAGEREADPSVGSGWYLHDDGVVRDYCYDDQFPQSTGYFPTMQAAWNAAKEYYAIANETYPYALVTDKDGSQSCARVSDTMINLIKDKLTVESEVMEFI